MSRRILSESKKATIEMGIKPIIGVIVAIIVILGITLVIFALLGIFSTKINQSSQGFFDKFFDATYYLGRSNTPDGTACYIQGAMDDDDGMLMFDAAAPTLDQRCGGNEEAEKPTKCGGMRKMPYGCLCVCNTRGDGADDDDCSESGSICTPIDKFKVFKYPDHDQFDDGTPQEDPQDWTWWSEPKSWSEGDSYWGPGHIYNYDCDGSVWGSGVNTYILKKAGETLLVKRVPQGLTIKGTKVDINKLNISSCNALIEKFRQESGGTPLKT